MAPYVFISYGREDQAVARRVADALEAEGLTVWWDVALRTGDAFDQVIEEALNQAAAVVVLWSPRSVTSRWVRAEATQAEANKTLAPAVIEPCKKPIMFALTQTADLSHWTGERSDLAWRAFVDDIRRLIDQRRAGQGAEAAPPQEALAGARAGAAPSPVRGPREGERRQVTVLSCSVAPAGPGPGDLDPEDWREIVVAVHREARTVMERFDATVLASPSDNLVALFGIGQTREDDAVRAVKAGLALTEMIQQFRPRQSPPLAVRVGIDTGVLVVGADGREPFGAPLGMAADLQSRATQNCVVISPATAAVAGGYLELEPVGAQAFRVVGLRDTLTRFDLSRARGLSSFVGRDAELRTLETALQRADAGEGQVVGIVAEAGTGKSRLCFEFLEQCRARGIRVFECRAAAHGRNIPFLPILELFRAFFDIRPEDDDALARQKVETRLVELDPSLGNAAPLVFDFLGISDPDRPAPRMDADTRQRQLMGLMRHVIQKGGETRVSVTLVEDLHWMDPASAEFLGHMIDARGAARSLLLLNYRPDYHADWMKNPWCQQIALAPLPTADIDALLTHMLGPDESVAPLHGMIATRTGGNPFFVEELVHTLVETGHLQGEPGHYRLTTPVARLEAPATVTAVVAARIDRLPGRERRLLQSAAVIGKVFSEPMLAAVAELPAKDLTAALAHLRRSEFIAEKSLFPVMEYEFRHPLTQEIALGSVLKDRRRKIHTAVARAIEQEDRARLDERAALLAHHWEAAGDSAMSAHWHRRAADWVGLTDLNAASWHWSRVRRELALAPPSQDLARIGLAACRHLLNLSWRFSFGPDEIRTLNEEGRAFARVASDRAGELNLSIIYSRALCTLGDVGGYLELARENYRDAEALGDPVVRINALTYLADALTYTARVTEALTLIEDAMTWAPEDVPRSEWLMGLKPTSILKFWRAACLTMSGRFEEAISEYRNLIPRVILDGTPEGGVYLWSWLALAYLSVGDIPNVIACADEVDRASLAMGEPPALVAHQHLCRTYVLLGSGRPAEAVAPARASLDIHRVLERQHEGFSLMLIAEALLQSGDIAAAIDTAERAVELLRRAMRGNLEAQALGVLARAVLSRDGRAGADPAAAILDRVAALVEETGANALAPSLLEWRAAVAAARGDEAGHDRLTREAMALFTAMGAPVQAYRLSLSLAHPAD